MKDGNIKIDSSSAYVLLGASNHSDKDRAEHDYYATDPVAISMLKKTGFFRGDHTVWEPAAGGGHLVRAMENIGVDVIASDKYVHDGVELDNVCDFLDSDPVECDAIVTNPPYEYAKEFCEKALEHGPKKIAMFLKITFLECQKRQKLFEKYPPRYVAVCVNRVRCLPNGDKNGFDNKSATCYAWFIWKKDYKGKPEILWVTKNGESSGK